LGEEHRPHERLVAHAGVAFRSESVRPRLPSFVVALVFVVLGVVEFAYFAGDDTERADGTSNWDAYPDARPFVVAAIVLCAATVVSATLFGLGRLPAFPAAIVGALALILLVMSWGMTLN
jgi:hypothetical protein